MNNQQAFNFDIDLGKQARDRGITVTILNNADFIATARSIARVLATKPISMDDVRKELDRRGIKPKTPNAYGAVFRGKGWVHVGWVKSSLITNHCRDIKVWRYQP